MSWAQQREAIRIAAEAGVRARTSAAGSETLPLTHHHLRYAMLSRPNGELTRAGQYYYQLIGRPPPSRQYDRNQPLIREGPNDYIMLRGGAKKLLRSLQPNGNYHLTKLGKSFFKDKWVDWVVHVPVIIRGIRRNGRNRGMPYERTKRLPVTDLNVTLSRQSEGLSDAQAARSLRASVLAQLGNPEPNDIILELSDETYYLDATREWTFASRPCRSWTTRWCWTPSWISLWGLCGTSPTVRNGYCNIDWLVAEEITQLDTGLWNDIACVSMNRKIKFLLLGDFRQFPAIMDNFAGTPVQRELKHCQLLHDLTDGWHHELTENMRSDPGIEYSGTGPTTTNMPQTMRVWPGLKLIGAGGRVTKGIYVHVAEVGPEKIVLDGGDSFTHAALLKHTRLCHAITYASCQGLTLEGRVFLCDTESPHFTLRHLYVGTSRATSSELLSVL